MNIFCWLWMLLGCGVNYTIEQGRTALEKHDLSAAEAYFRDALQHDPKNEEAMSGLGWTYHLAGETDAARSVFNRCFEFFPESTECLRGLGSISIVDGKLVQARAWIEDAQRLKPTDPKVESSVALLALVEGRLSSAQERYQSLSQRYPSQAEYRLGLGECYFRLDKPLKSAEIATEALKITGTPKRYSAMLWALRARSLLKATAGVEDPNDCERTAPPIYEWLAEAEHSIDKAIETEVSQPDIYVVQRQILRRRSMISEVCPAIAPE
jgi:tetratricopeptide (TPR) repeat protein